MNPGTPNHFHYKEIGSTNDEALRLLDEENIKTPFFVTAESQTAGRGRLNRRWHSPKGNLYFTAVFPGEIPLTKLSTFTLYSALSLCDALQKKTQAGLWVKWPNDLWIGKKKCAGFLAESPISQTSGRVLVLGIGLNVNTTDFPMDIAARATSLKLSTNKIFDIIELTQILANSAQASYQDMLSGEYKAKMPSLWRVYDRLSDNAITFDRDGKISSGTVLGITDEGMLCVKTSEKTIERLNAGEVTLSKFL